MEWMRLTVNGAVHSVGGDPSRSLLTVLRDDLDLTGAKYGCGEAQCGACVVLLDGEPVPACVTPMGSAAGRDVETIEGLAPGAYASLRAAIDRPVTDRPVTDHPVSESSAGPPATSAPPGSQALHPVQRAFMEETAMQCGYCTPGMIMGTVALLRKNPHPDQDEIKRALDGHLCRCGVYARIVRAVLRAADLLEEARSETEPPTGHVQEADQP